MAVPPSCAMMPAVSCAAARLRSTQKTCAPSRANTTAVALPLPQPGPIDPAPMTSATLPFRRGIGGSRRGRDPRLLGRRLLDESRHDLLGDALELFQHHRLGGAKAGGEIDVFHAGKAALELLQVLD